MMDDQMKTSAAIKKQFAAQKEEDQDEDADEDDEDDEDGENCAGAPSACQLHMVPWGW